MINPQMTQMNADEIMYVIYFVFFSITSQHHNLVEHYIKE